MFITMKSETILITGSTSGIGYAAAKQLAKQGVHLIIHGRSKDKCEQTVQEIKHLTHHPHIDYIVADLSDLAQVREMALQIKQRFPQLSVLILNAGTFSHIRKITQDGLELTWVVNYLSRFLLTQLLLDLLKQNTPSRIVDVSGAYHAYGKIHFDDLTLQNNYSMSVANSQSKLAIVLFTYKLARVIEDRLLTINTLHPGAVNTGSVLRSEGFSNSAKWMYRIFSPFFKTPQQGASTLVYLTTSTKVATVSGKYFVNQKPKRSAKASYDIALQDRLWETSKAFLKNKNYWL